MDDDQPGELIAMIATGLSAEPERHPLEPLFILMDHSFRIVEARRKRNPEQSGSQSNPPCHAWHERQVPHRLLVRVGLVDVEPMEIANLLPDHPKRGQHSREDCQRDGAHQPGEQYP